MFPTRVVFGSYDICYAAFLEIIVGKASRKDRMYNNVFWNNNESTYTIYSLCLLIVFLQQRTQTYCINNIQEKETMKNAKPQGHFDVFTMSSRNLKEIKH